MRSSRLPPLNALRAFESVARHRSFRKAADELFVTPAAITHQIKALESQLGIELFRRFNRRIELTERAREALPALQEAFELLSESVTLLRESGNNTPRLTIGASPTFVSRWLVPRLQGFLARNAGIDVSFVAGSQHGQVPGHQEMSPPLNSAGGTDLEIRLCHEEPDGQAVDPLFAVEVVPMCHFRLINGTPPLKKPSDLRFHTLLHGDGRRVDRNQSTWANWLRHAGIDSVDPRRGLQLEHSTLALEAATDGLGVTLAMPLLAQAELEAGSVVVAFDIPLPLNSAYYAISNPGALRRPEVQAFRMWLTEETHGLRK